MRRTGPRVGISDLKPTQHLCWIYEKEEEHRAVLTPFLRQGLEIHQRVTCILDTHTADTVLDYLRDDGVNVEPYLASGQLKFLRSDETYTSDGIFDPDAMVARLKSETDRAVADGYQALRVTGEMSWVLRRPAGAGRLVEYESKLCEFFAGNPCVGLCQYDSRSLDSALLLEVLDTHPIVVVGTTFYDNFYFISPADSIASNRADLTLQRRIENLAARKQLAEAMWESEERYRSLVETINDFVWEVDASGVYTYVSPQVEDLLGYKPEEVLGRTPMELMPPEEAVRIERIVRETFAAREPLVSCENINLRKDGTRAVLETRGAPFCAPDGTLLGYRGVDRDITRRKQREEQYTTVLGTAMDGFWVIDTTRRLLEVNDAYCDLVGYSCDELLKMRIEDVEANDDAQACARRIQRILETGSDRFRTRHRHKDGRLIDLEVIAKCSPLWDGRIFVFLRDNTEQRRLEAQLLQAQKLESVGRLAGGLAHDFNNLLTVINGYCELILDKLEKGDPLRDGIEEIRRAGERANSLTQQLLAFSRRQVFRLQVLDLNSVVTEVKRMLHRLIGEDVELIALLHPSLWLVKGDAGQIHHVLMNLAVNARDAMPSGGKLIVETGNVSVEEDRLHEFPIEAPGDYVLLAVSDTGIGMDEETMTQIFEPFFTTKETGKGTGLGLSTVYGIVMQSGGWIGVHSELGNGTTFKIYLPRVKMPFSAPEAPESTPVALRGTETILLVEDEQEVRRLASVILKSYGYNVLEAANAGEALLACERFSGPIHLMVTDVVMPGMSGNELARRLRPLRPDVKVLHMSGYTENIVFQEEIVALGAAYIQKPFTPESLAGKVREVLGQRRQSKRIMVVDDEPQIRQLLRQILSNAGYEVVEADPQTEISSEAPEPRVNLVIADLATTQDKDLELIRRLRVDSPDLKVIALLSASGGDLTDGVRTLGVATTLAKPISASSLLEAVRKLVGREE